MIKIKKIFFILIIMSSFLLMPNILAATNEKLDNLCKTYDRFTTGRISSSNVTMCTIYNGSDVNRKNELINGTSCLYKTEDGSGPFSWIRVAIDDFTFYWDFSLPGNTITYYRFNLCTNDSPYTPLRYFYDDQFPMNSNNELIAVNLQSYVIRADTFCPESLYIKTENNVTYDMIPYGEMYKIYSGKITNAIEYKKTETLTGVDHTLNLDPSNGSVLDTDGNPIIEYPSTQLPTGDPSLVINPNNVEGIDFCSQNGVRQVLYIAGVVGFIGKLVIPLLLIIMGTIDLVKALKDPDDKSMKDQFSMFTKRILAAIIVFLAPTIINLGFSLIDNANNSNFSGCTECLFNPFGGNCSYTKIGQDE